MTKAKTLTSLISVSLFGAALLISGCSTDPKPHKSVEVASKGAHGGALSSDGKHAIVGSINQGGSLWRLRDGERLYNWNHEKDEQTTIVTADFSPDGKWALTAEAHKMVLWDVETGQAQRFWTSPGEVLSVALSNSTRSGIYALLGLSDHTAVIFNVTQGRISRTFNHQGRVRSVDLSDDLRFALTGSEDYSAVLWDIASGKELQRIQHEDDVQLVSLSGDGSLAFSGSKYDRSIIWLTEDASIVAEVPVKRVENSLGMRVTSAEFNSDSKYLLTGRPDQTVQLWRLKTANSDRGMSEVKRWRLPKRDAWKPTSAAVLAVSFTEQGGTYRAIASNGFVHTLKRSSK